jgi:hypothetical protein
LLAPAMSWPWLIGLAGFAFAGTWQTGWSVELLELW